MASGLRVSINLATKKTEQFFDVVAPGGAGSVAQGVFAGNVTNGGSFPTTRRDGTALQNEDYVRPLATSIFPFTIGTCTFTNVRDKALYTPGTGWAIDPGAIQTTSETPVTNMTEESVSGTAGNQYVVNKEVVDELAKKVTKSTGTADTIYARLNGNEYNLPYSKSATENTAAWRGAGGKLKVGTATANDEAVNFGQFTTELNKKLDKATATVSIEHAYIHKSDGTDGLMQINGNANASNAIVRRQPNNQLKVPVTPVDNDDAASKQYVDNKEAKVDNVTTELNASKEIQIKDGGVSTAKIADTAVTNAKIADTTITGGKIANNTITKDKTTASFWEGNSFTGTTNAVNFTVSGDTNLKNVVVSDSITVPVPTTDDQAVPKKYVDELAGKVMKFKGYVASSAPTGAKEGHLWYEGTAMPTTFPIQVKTYDGTAWSATTSAYTPEDLDLWSNKNDDHGYYWFGNAWNRIDSEFVLDNVTLGLNESSQAEVKQYGLGLDRLAKQASSIGKIIQVGSEGIFGLADLKNYEQVNTFEGVSGNTYTMYYLDTPRVIGTKSYTIGLYTWAAATGFTIVANVGGGGSSSPILVGVVSPGGTFPTTRPDGSALVIGDYVKPYEGSTFPFTIGTVTFERAGDTAVYMTSGSWLRNASVYQKTNETPVFNKANESINGSDSSADYQAGINAENKTAINASVSQGTFSKIAATESQPVKLKLNLKNRLNGEVLNTSLDDVVFLAETQTLTNKSIDADTNEISNIETDNLKEDVLVTDLDENATDTQLPSAKTTWDNLEKRLRQYTSMPTASLDYEGKFVQYVGNTTASYTHNNFYECKLVAGAYVWQNVSSGGNYVPQLTTMPAISTEYDTKTIMYDGVATSALNKGFLYQRGEREYWEVVIQSAYFPDPDTVYSKVALSATRVQMYSDTACTITSMYWADSEHIYDSQSSSSSNGDVLSSTKKTETGEWKGFVPAKAGDCVSINEATINVANSSITVSKINPTALSTGIPNTDASPNKLTTESIIRYFFDQMFPIGCYAFGQHPTLGTWVEVEGDRAIWIKNGIASGTLISQALPKPTMTFTGEEVVASASGSHDHTFTGKSGTTSTQSASHTHSGTTASSGAHTHSETYGAAWKEGSSGNQPSYRDKGNEKTFSCDEAGAHTHTITTGNQSASHTHTLTPTGTINTIGNHAHLVTAVGSVTCDTAGVYGEGTKVQPDAIVMTVWQRTA